MGPLPSFIATRNRWSHNFTGNRDPPEVYPTTLRPCLNWYRRPDKVQSCNPAFVPALPDQDPNLAALAKVKGCDADRDGFIGLGPIHYHRMLSTFSLVLSLHLS
jgi:hypothetical protein